MEWIEQLNSAINYMEEHLEDGIDLEKVAEIACCSSFHFQRMFSYIADIPLSEYIRRRKMTRVARQTSILPKIPIFFIILQYFLSLITYM